MLVTFLMFLGLMLDLFYTRPEVKSPESAYDMTELAQINL